MQKTVRVAATVKCGCRTAPVNLELVECVILQHDAAAAMMHPVTADAGLIGDHVAVSAQEWFVAISVSRENIEASEAMDMSNTGSYLGEI